VKGRAARTTYKGSGYRHLYGFSTYLVVVCQCLAQPSSGTVLSKVPQYVFVTLPFCGGKPTRANGFSIVRHFTSLSFTMKGVYLPAAGPHTHGLVAVSGMFYTFSRSGSNDPPLESAGRVRRFGGGQLRVREMLNFLSVLRAKYFGDARGKDKVVSRQISIERKEATVRSNNQA